MHGRPVGGAKPVGGSNYVWQTSWWIK